MFLNICSQSAQCNFPWPYTANSIENQLTQLFPHMFIQAYTDYWNVRPAVRPYALKILSTIVNISVNDFKVYSFVYVIKYIYVNDCFVICVGTSLLLRCDTSILFFTSGLTSASFQLV